MPRRAPCSQSKTHGQRPVILAPRYPRPAPITEPLQPPQLARDTRPVSRLSGSPTEARDTCPTGAISGPVARPAAKLLNSWGICLGKTRNSLYINSLGGADNGPRAVGL